MRNGSLLLYSALVYRSFGARKNLTTINKRVALSEFFGSNSTLIDLFQQELVLRVESTTSESLGSVFAILLVLSLLSASATSSYIVDALRPAVDTYTASSVWQVRVAAAAAMTGLTPASNMDETVCAALTAAAQSSHTNKVHGLLLRALYIIRTGDRAPSEDTGARDISTLCSYKTDALWQCDPYKAIFNACCTIPPVYRFRPSLCRYSLRSEVS